MTKRIQAKTALAGDKTGPQPTFPAELLQQSTSQKLAYFERKMMAHPRLLEADRELGQAINYPAGSSLVFLYGPAGVGKTILLRRVMERLGREALTAMQENPTHVPFLFGEAVPPTTANFDWREFYLRLLLRANEPLPERKLDQQSIHSLAAGAQWQVLSSNQPTTISTANPAQLAHNAMSGSSSVAGLRRVLENWIAARQPKAIVIDQAQHLRKVSSGRRLVDQMDNLKSLADMTNTVIILVGSYELLSLANLNAQLNRRSHQIHFPRYRFSLLEDISSFQNCVLTLQRHLPLDHEPDLISQCEYLYERSLGCVGLLKLWLTRTLATRLEAERVEARPQAYLDLLPKQAWSAPRLALMSEELNLGERQLSDNPADVERIRHLLGMPTLVEKAHAPRPNVAAVPPATITSNTASNQARDTSPAEVTPTTQTTKQRGVGTRKPHRDPIGRDDAEANTQQPIQTTSKEVQP